MKAVVSRSIRDARPAGPILGFLSLAAAASLYATAAHAVPTFTSDIEFSCTGCINGVFNSPTALAFSLTNVDAAHTNGGAPFPAATVTETGITKAAYGVIGAEAKGHFALPATGQEGVTASAGGSAFARAAFDLDNILITGPALQPFQGTPYSLNFTLSGNISTSVSSSGAQRAEAQVLLGYSTTAHGISATGQSLGSLGGTGQDLGHDLEGSNFGTPVLDKTGIFKTGATSGTTTVFDAVPNTFVEVSLILTTNVLLNSFSDQFTPGSADAAAAFQDTVTLPTSGPVFNLADGYTANSLDGCIVNNRFLCGPAATVAVPEPPTFALMAVALAGFGFTVRRRRGSCRRS